MSCESNTNKISKVVCQVYAGISQLASKGSFYAGVAVGATGTGMSMLVVSKIRRPKKIEARPTLVKVEPDGRSLQNDTKGRSRPASARRPRPGTPQNPLPFPMDLLEATPAKRQKQNSSLPNMNAVKLPQSKTDSPPLPDMGPLGGWSQSNLEPIPVLSAKPLETNLEMAPIQVLTSSGQSFTPKISYRVVRSDRSNSGLSLTPYIREDEQGQPLEDENAWCVTHINSGALISGPYETLSKAHRLATQLSALPWTSAHLPEPEVEKAKQIIGEYQGSLGKG